MNSLSLATAQVQEALHRIRGFRDGHQPGMKRSTLNAIADRLDVAASHLNTLRERASGAAPGDALGELIGCFDAALAEGLQDALDNTQDERLKDLVERRLMIGYWDAVGPSPAVPFGFKLVPVERSYDQRAKALIAFNTTEAKAGCDRDDALQAAWEAALSAAPRAERSSGAPWLRDGSLLFRLTDTPHGPSNCDEIHITMVAGSRRTEDRERAAQELGAILSANPATPSSAQAAAPFQQRVQPWMMACFGPVIAGDREERNHRFLEEALELVQATGCSASEAHQLVDYVYGRPVGEPVQEVGGVMVTLAALCLANGLDMHDAAEVELARIWTKVEAIRAKQAAKPKHSPLPEHAATASEAEAEAEAVGVLAHLDALHDDAAAHIFPSDLERCMTSECCVEVASVRMGRPGERSVPLFSRQQVVDALAAAKSQEGAA